MKLTNSQIFEINSAIEMLPNSSIEFGIPTYITLLKIKKNTDIISESIKQASKSCKNYLQFMEDIKNIALKLCSKDEHGKPDFKIENGKYIFNIPEDKKEVIKFGKEELEKEYKEDIKAEENRKIELKKFLDESQEIEINTIKSTDLSGNLKDSLSKKIITALIPIFEDL